jgi:hypothetical protein
VRLNTDSRGSNSYQECFEHIFNDCTTSQRLHFSQRLYPSQRLLPLSDSSLSATPPSQRLLPLSDSSLSATPPSQRLLPLSDYPLSAITPSQSDCIPAPTDAYPPRVTLLPAIRPLPTDTLLPQSWLPQTNSMKHSLRI